MITVLALSPSLDVTVLVRTLDVGGISRPSATHRVAGGKALNAARVASRLGAEVTVVALLGGPTGDHVAALLGGASPGIRLWHIPVEGETRLCVSIAADDADRLTELYEPAPPVGDWSLVPHAIAAVPAGDWIVVSGSVPEGIDPATLATALEGAMVRGVRLAVDTHGPALAALVRVRPALVKVNRAEAAEMLGVAASGSAAGLAEHLHARTGGIVMVTDGVDGSVAVVPGIEDVVVVRPDTERGRFPVGSGDSVLGALVAALDRGVSPVEALRDAAAAGSANAAVPGAADFDLDAFETVRARIVVTTGVET